MTQHISLPSQPSSQDGTIRITLMGAPQGKARPRHGKGFTYTPAHTRAFESALRYAAQVAMAGRPPLEGPLSLRLDAHMPIPASWSARKHRLALMGQVQPTTKPDADNLLKCIDSCNGIVWRDDAQIVTASVAKRYSERPRIEIEVVPVDAIAAQAGVGRATGKRVAA